MISTHPMFVFFRPENSSFCFFSAEKYRGLRKSHSSTSSFLLTVGKHTAGTKRTLPVGERFLFEMIHASNTSRQEAVYMLLTSLCFSTGDQHLY